MKTRNKFLILIFGVLSYNAQAQRADSIIIFYDNQKTVVPVPAFGNRTAVKYTDSADIIEFAISRWNPKVNSIRTETNEPANRKANQVTSWFAQYEAGYIKNFNTGYSYISFYNENYFYAFEEYNNSQGFRLGLSVYEKARKHNSLVTGFNFGYCYLLGPVSESFSTIDTSSRHVYYDTARLDKMVVGAPLIIQRLQFLFPFEYRYKPQTAKPFTCLRFGANIGLSFDLYKVGNYGNVQSFKAGSENTAIFQPYAIMEIGRAGFRTAFDLIWGLPSFGLTFSFTYRFNA